MWRQQINMCVCARVGARAKRVPASENETTTWPHASESWRWFSFLLPLRTQNPLCSIITISPSPYGRRSRQPCTLYAHNVILQLNQTMTSELLKFYVLLVPRTPMVMHSNSAHCSLVSVSVKTANTKKLIWIVCIPRPNDTNNDRNKNKNQNENRYRWQSQQSFAIFIVYLAFVSNANPTKCCLARERRKKGKK